MNPRQTIAFFTGPSDRERCALSPEQQAFIAQLAGDSREIVPVNFPFQATAPYRDVPLWRASWNNVRIYFSSRGKEFSRQHRARVSALIERSEQTIFLVGSCGLELFNNLNLPEELETRCVLICYGPVARRVPRFAKTVVVQSKRDFISRAFFAATPAQLRCGHLGYLRDPRFLELCRAVLSNSSPSLCGSISV